MFVCEFIVAIIGVTDGSNHKAVSAMISFIVIVFSFLAGQAGWHLFVTAVRG